MRTRDIPAVDVMQAIPRGEPEGLTPEIKAGIAIAGIAVLGVAIVWGMSKKK